MRQIFVIACLLAWVAAGRAQECDRVLTGHVQDEDTRENLEGATVLIEETGVLITTEKDGTFRYSKLCDGSYTLTVSHIGCLPYTVKIQIQKNTHLDISLPHLRNNLDEVVVSGVRTHAVSSAEQVKTRDLELSKGFSVADALSRLNGVNILQTGSTIAKPVIHGLHSIRVLTINNGVRQEGQQWGTEHAPEIDPYIADRLTLVKGVDQLRYGSDAIGGVVLVDPKPIRSLPGYGGELNTGYFTNNGQFVVSGFFEQQLQKLSALNYRVQGTFKKAGNIKTPDYRLNNTGVEEINFSAAANWRKEHYQLQAFYSEFQSTIGLFPFSHVGNLTDLLERIKQSQPDEVYLNEKTYRIDRPRQEVLHRLFKLKGFLAVNEHKFTLTVSGQYNHRSEYDVVRAASITGPQIALALTTFSEDFSYEHPSVRNLRGTVGLNFTQQENSYSGRYLIPNYTAASFGAYLIEKWRKEKWELSAGLRFDNRSIDTRRLRYGGEMVDHNFDFATFAASFNGNYAINNFLKANAGLSLSTRAPQVNELLSAGIHQGAGGYAFLQGDIQLKTEKSTNISAGLSYRKEAWSADLRMYHHNIRDFIFTAPKPGEPVLTVTGAAPKLQYGQTDARLSGLDLSAGYVFHRIALNSQISILRARDRREDDWLILMPADRWRNELAYHLSENSFIGLEHTVVFAPRVPSDGVALDYKEAPGAYSLLNMNSSFSLSIFKTQVTLGVSVRNVLNTRYRDYLNLFRYYADEMGRNFILRLKVPFNHNKL